MALDAALSAGPEPIRPTLRLYGWRPWTLSLGWFQRVREEDLAPFRDAGYGVTRRMTGGGAILHGEELTYAVILPTDDPRIPRGTEASYQWLHAAVIEALAESGVAAAARGPASSGDGPDPFFCFARTAPIDLVVDGRKLVGSAQRRTREAFLQHGSIPLAPDPTVPGATSVGAATGRAARREVLEDALAGAFGRLLAAAVVEAAPDAAERSRARGIERTRFANPAWVLRPWRGAGRACAPPDAAGLPPVPGRTRRATWSVLQGLRTRIADGHLEVKASRDGTHPRLPLAGLRAVEVARIEATEAHALSVERDPWDSTFRRSAFAHAHGPAGPEGRPPTTVEVRRETLAVALAFDDAPRLVHLDAARHNWTDLGDRATGEWRADLRTWLADLAAAAPAARRGPGATTFLQDDDTWTLPGVPELLDTTADLAGGRPKS